MKGISNKWPAARLSGPDVSHKNALEFIRRTDSFFNGHVFSNNKTFESDFKELIGNPYKFELGSFGEWQSWNEQFKENFGYIELKHLASKYISSAYIGGPNGPVSHSGKVSLACNFGKWPNVEEIEEDLKNISYNFPWLSFTLAIWDSSEEGGAVRVGNEPDISWKLNNGSFKRQKNPSWSDFEGFQFPSEGDIISIFAQRMNTGVSMENTWTIEQIDKMWGEQIRQASKNIKVEENDLD